MGEPKKVPQTAAAAMVKFPSEAAAIVEIISAWNIIEDDCTRVFANLTGMHPLQADLVMASITTSRTRLDMFKSAAQFALAHNPELLKKFIDVLDFVSRRLTYRNRVAHGIYEQDGNGTLYLSSRRHLPDDRHRLTPVRMTDLREELSQVSQAMTRLQNIHQEIWQAHPLELRKAFVERWRLPNPSDPSAQE